ncbi:hypothetical protein P3S67_019014 [Capsicum chacoense]
MLPQGLTLIRKKMTIIRVAIYIVILGDLSMIYRTWTKWDPTHHHSKTSQCRQELGAYALAFHRLLPLQ